MYSDPEEPFGAEEDFPAYALDIPWAEAAPAAPIYGAEEDFPAYALDIPWAEAAPAAPAAPIYGAEEDFPAYALNIPWAEAAPVPTLPTLVPTLPTLVPTLGLTEQPRRIPQPRREPRPRPEPRGKAGGVKVSDGLRGIIGGLAKSIPGLGTALNLADVAGMTLGALGIKTDGQLALPGFGRKAGPRRRAKRVGLPRRMPTKAQWKRINKRLHEYRGVAIGVIGRTGGMRSRRQHRYHYQHHRRRR